MGGDGGDEPRFRYAASVTRPDGRAAWGPARAAAAEAQRDRMGLLLALEAGGDAALRSALQDLRRAPSASDPPTNNANEAVDGIFGSSDSEEEED